MKKALRIFAVIAALVLVISCSKKAEHKIIPAATLSKIYAEMLLSDQWLVGNKQYSKIADTTLVYEPIFNKYGYTTDDYIATVDYYLYDPEHFTKIARKATEILQKQRESVFNRKTNPQDENDR